MIESRLANGSNARGAITLCRFLRSFRSVAADRKRVTAAQYAVLAVDLGIVAGVSVAALFDPSTGAFRVPASTLGSTISFFSVAPSG
jgi:hypothetical protein